MVERQDASMTGKQQDQQTSDFPAPPTHGGAWSFPAVLIFPGVTIFLLLARWPFHFIQILPSYLAFRPDISLVPLVGLMGGPAGACGCLAAELLGDAWLGLWSPLSFFHATGQFLFAYSAWRLWAFRWFKTSIIPVPTGAWQHNLRFLTAAFPGAWIAATWVALGAEWTRIYPFAYIFGIVLVQNLLFLFLLGPAFYELAVLWVAGRRRDRWRAPPVCSLRAAGLILAGGLGAGLFGIIVSLTLYGIPVFRPARLGFTSGVWMKLLVTLLCLGPWAFGFRKEWTRRRQSNDGV